MAPLANALENLGFLGMSLLAVVGGAVAGALLTALLVWLVCRLFFRKQLPRPVRKILRLLGGAAGALAVAGYLKFGGGSGWLFGDGGPGTGGGQSQGQAALNPEAPKPKTDPPQAKADEPPPAQADRVQVVILGGPLVKGRAFYRVEGRKEAVDLSGVQEVIRKRRQASPLAAVDVLIYQNSLDYKTEPVEKLRAWITESGLTPRLVELSGDIPP